MAFFLDVEARQDLGQRPRFKRVRLESDSEESNPSSDSDSDMSTESDPPPSPKKKPKSKSKKRSRDADEEARYSEKRHKVAPEAPAEKVLKEMRKTNKILANLTNRMKSTEKR